MNKIAISSLCFANFKGNFLTYICNLNFKKIELAPTMVSKKFNLKKLSTFKKKITEKKMEVVAIQSLFFGININIDDKDFDTRFQNHMFKIVKICKIFNCKQINLGSSAVRYIKNPKNKKELEKKFLYSIKKFLNKYDKLNINLEPIKSSKQNQYVFQNYNDCIQAVRNSNKKNLKVLYDLLLADFYNLILKKNDIINDLYGHIHLNNFKVDKNINIFIRKILNKFILNSYSGFFSLEIFLNKKKLYNLKNICKVN